MDKMSTLGTTWRIFEKTVKNRGTSTVSKGENPDISIKPRLKSKNRRNWAKVGGLTNPIDLSSRDEFRSSFTTLRALICPFRIPNNQFAKSDCWHARRLPKYLPLARKIAGCGICFGNTYEKTVRNISPDSFNSGQ
ncbi:hypothetical protein K0M31_006095 [Melipona bicolor]|uniref:Uncharacterized protein n=1 Tax=Melipona bicolor TaxID=60889 RepID=A0AA40FSV8_9HYME|nr:hypothetical protein K0M31_006095 [Melipona bicolor]